MLKCKYILIDLLTLCMQVPYRDLMLNEYIRTKEGNSVLFKTTADTERLKRLFSSYNGSISADG